MLILSLIAATTAYSIPAIFNRTGLDHGVVDNRHSNATQKFILKNFFEEGVYSKAKVSTFLSSLKKERDFVLDQIYETKVLEKLELDVKKWKLSKKKAKKTSSKIMRYETAYNQYLIPKIKKILAYLNQGVGKDKVDPLVHDFVRGYLAFYSPNAFRSYWPRDYQIVNFAKRVLISEAFYENDGRVEAFNLQVEHETIKMIQGCLGPQIKVGHYLSQSEIKKIKKCDIDLSKINPGVSPLWKKLSKEERKHLHEEDLVEYPKENQDVWFKRVILRSRGSPKIKVGFISRDGNKKYLKLKFSNEVHVDRSVSKIFELTGFNQDQMLYRDKVRVQLRDTSIESFKSLLSNKYGIASLQRFIHSEGGGEGQEWIILKDVLFEAKPDNELRLGPVDIGSWDLMNRREFRSFYMMLCWLGVVDTKMGNFRFSLKKNKAGEYIPLVRMHDLGYALTPTLMLRKPRSVLNLGAGNYQVNEFEESFLKPTLFKKGVKLLWNDPARRVRNTTDTSYSDLKWMARQIAAVDERDIYRAMIESGMPEPVAKVYHLKLITRRNHMLEVFNLDEEIPKIPVSKVKEFNPYPNQPNPPVKNGKVVQTAFTDKTNTVHIQRNWLTLLSKLATFDVPVHEWNLASSNANVETSLLGLEGLKADIGYNSSRPSQLTNKVQLGVGVHAFLGRKVSGNAQIVNLEGKNHLFKIVDRVTISFDIDSPLLKKTLNSVPGLGANATLRFFSMQFEYIHYSDHGNKAYVTPFILHKILKNINKFAAHQLKNLEVFTIYNRYGVELETGIGLSTNTPINNEVSLLGANRMQLKTYYYRDQYSQLHVYKDGLADSVVGLNFDLATANLFSAKAPFLRIQNGRNKYSLNSKNYVFTFPCLDREESKAFLTPMRRKQEYKILKELDRKVNIDQKYDFVRSRFDFASNGQSNSHQYGALWAFNRERLKGWSRSTAALANGKVKNFYRSYSIKNKSVGLEKFSLGLKNSDIAMNWRKRIRIDTEMEVGKPKKFVTIIRMEDFYRKKDRAGLVDLINDLNRRYSKKESKPIYRDYILPDAEDVDSYPKVYALTRIYIDGKTLVNQILSMNEEDLSYKLYQHFSDQGRLNGKKVLKFFAKKSVSSVMRTIKKLKKNLQQKNISEEPRASSKQYHKLFRQLKLETYGITIVKKLVGSKHLFVTSEIAGVLPSFSAMQDFQQQQRRRFMGISWGSYHQNPPIQKFLRYQRLIPKSVHVEKLLPDNLVLGPLETGLAPDMRDQ